jgi:catechol 2,3-dioxygenase-like lactoylglutathione lyase family enzyme
MERIVSDNRWEEDHAMIDHLGISVTNHAASKAFYSRALAPLGIGVIMEVPKAESGGPSDYTGFGADGKPFFWIGEGAAPERMHVCFTATTRAQVDAFYRTALELGARDNGAPGLRPHYHPNYYGAFVIDLNGINLEAVCHSPR